jgi:hypothetical protein
MSQVWLLAALWVGLALIAVLVTIKFNQAQYSYIVATVIASAVVPTVIANAFFLPRHHLPAAIPEPDREAEELGTVPAIPARDEKKDETVLAR